MYGEVRFPVAVHVAVDVGVGDIPDVTQLALLAAEGGSTGEEKRLIAAIDVLASIAERSIGDARKAISRLQGR